MIPEPAWAKAPHTSEPQKLDQTRVGDLHGNCWHACIACLLGVEPEDVPDPRCFEPWRSMSAADLRKAKDTMGEPKAEGSPQPLPYWEEFAAPWLQERGFAVMSRYAEDPLPFLRPYFTLSSLQPFFWIANGFNQDGHGHAVVCRGSQQWWDPNPSRGGLSRIDGFTLLLARPWVTQQANLPETVLAL